MAKFLVLLISVASGITFFVVTEVLLLLAGLLVLTLVTRFSEKHKEAGKFIEMLFIFCLISTAINELGIYYPYSLIIVLTVLVVLIFYEGPEWGNVYFGFGKTQAHFKLTLIFAVIASLMFGGAIFLFRSRIQNPVPLSWPFDALLIVGIGFALYLAIVEEMIFRSFLLQRAESAAGFGSAIVAQASFFGLMYYRSGVPGNVLGVILGTVLGLGLGYLVKKTESIYPAILVHFIVTFVIFIELTILGKF